MKYIVFDQGLGTTDFPVMFPNMLEHGEVARKFGGNDNVLSAGFISFAVDCDGVTVEAHGKATSIPDKPARDVDTAILQRALKRY